MKMDKCTLNGILFIYRDFRDQKIMEIDINVFEK